MITRAVLNGDTDKLLRVEQNLEERHVPSKIRGLDISFHNRTDLILQTSKNETLTGNKIKQTKLEIDQ